MITHDVNIQSDENANWEVQSMETCNVGEKVSNDLSQAILNRENDDCLGVATRIPTVKECLI